MTLIPDQLSRRGLIGSESVTPAAAHCVASAQAIGVRSMVRKSATARTFDAMPDTIDFRDAMYIPTLVEVPPIRPEAPYRTHAIPVLDQGREGACTGFGLATVANYLLKTRSIRPDATSVSARMLYTMAKRYDEWPGEDYDGSSARGAMKGWHKHGICAGTLWADEDPEPDLTAARAADAITRPLGSYFRVNHKDLVAMHSAISEVGVLFATCRVHSGWMDIRSGETDIRFARESLGGHAFAIVGYDERGFWIQNSWGTDWGAGGLARIGYDDWLINGTDVWVARMGVPLDLNFRATAAQMQSAAPRSYESYVYAALRPHVVTIGNDGELRAKGPYGLTPQALTSILREHLPTTVKAWKTRRVLLYAHGGLVPETYAFQYANNYREAAMQAEVYPLSFVWRSDLWTTIGNLLQDAISRRKDEGLLDAAKDFMFDRIDDTLEPLARWLGGKALWDEMKENAARATTRAKGGARQVAEHLIASKAAGEIDEIHLAAHSAGAIFVAELAKHLASRDCPIKSVSLWAPACTIELYTKVYRPLIRSGAIGSFDLYTLDDATEQDDECKGIYHKSLLYLVSAAFESRPRIPGVNKVGTPLLGLARDVKGAVESDFKGSANQQWFVAPASPGSDARHHGDFDNDRRTLESTLARIIDGGRSTARPSALHLPRAAGGIQKTRAQIDIALK